MAGKIKKNKGFTMVEVIVVLVILAIVAAFSAPTLMGYVDDVNLKDCQAKERDISKSYIEVLANKGVEKPTATVDIGAVCDIMTAKGAPSTEGDTYKALYAAKTAAEAKNGDKLNSDASAVLEFTGICTTGGKYKVTFINDSPFLECSQHGYVGNKPEPTATPSTSVLPTPTPEPVTLKSLRATPSSQEYIEGQTFKKSDFTFYASYSDGSEIPIANSEVTLDKTPDLNQITSEPIVVTASYAGVQAKISITVRAPKVTSISVKTKPTKLSYAKGEIFNPEGGMLTVNYDFGASKEVPMTDAGCSFTGNDTQSVSEKKTVTVSYGGASTTFDIAVTEAQLTGISLSKTPQTTFYKGEAFNTTGGQITATYTDGTTKEIALTVYMCRGYNMMEQGTQTVTVSYTEGNITKTGTYNITVGAPIVVSIKMGKLPNKTTYVQGNTFSAEGGTFIRVYSDGMESEPLALEYTDNDNKVYDYCSDPNMHQLGQQDVIVTDPEYKGSDGVYLTTGFTIIINEQSNDDVKKIIEALDNELYDNNNFWPSQTVYYYYHHWIKGSERRTTTVELNATHTSVYDDVLIWKSRNYYGETNNSILAPLLDMIKSTFEKQYNWAIVPNNYEGGYNPSIKTSDADTYGYTIYVYKGDISAVTVGDSVQVTTYSTIHPTGDGYGSALIKVAQSKNTKYLDVKSAVSWMYFNPIEDGKMLDAIQKAGNNVMNSESGGEKVTQVETELKNNGYDLKAMGINAWGYTQDKELLWTTIDIHSVSGGTMVPIMRYNNSSGSYNGTYTVWWCKVDETSNQYPYLDTGHKNEYSESSVIKEAVKKKDFDQMVQWYSHALKEYEAQ